MSFFEKTLNPNPHSENPNNERLIILLNNWSQNRNGENYGLVVEELMKGNSYLILPSVNDANNGNGWTTTKQDTTLKLTTVFNLDGLKVLGAFTDEASLSRWAKHKQAYTSLKSQAVFDLCQRLDVSRIVINSDSPNMFVMERQNKNIQEFTFEKGTEISMGTPNKPLSEAIIDKLIHSFQEINNVDEAYQYMQSANKAANIVIGLRLSPNTENARTASINAVQKALSDESKDFYIDINILDTEVWYKRVKNIKNSLFYKRESI
jgi:hypothetical protein